MRWEYRVVQDYVGSTDSRQSTRAKLDDYGARGWELVGVAAFDAQMTVVLFLRRPVRRPWTWSHIWHRWRNR